MNMRPNIHFPGNAEDVLEHYRAALGGEPPEVVRFAGSPVADGLPGEWAGKILYAKLRTPFGDLDLMDAPPGREIPSGGNVAIAIDVDDEDRAANIFAKLAEGGEILMPFAQTFFARKFGMTNDKFGVRWMIGVAPVVAAR